MADTIRPWPGPLLEKLSRRFYEEILNDCPTPEDVVWDDLQEDEQLKYVFATESIIKQYCAEVGVPVIGL